MQVKAPHAKCDECSLKEQKFVPGEGPDKAEVVFVGEAPGAQEAFQGKPFAGQAGKLLNKCLEQLGIDRSKCYVTNTCLCRPEKNRTPKADEIEACRDRLIAEVKVREPKIVVVLGNTAIKAILGLRQGVTSVRGKSFWSDELNCWVMPTYHPAAILRQPGMFQDYAADLQKITEIAKKDPDEKDQDLETEYWVVNNLTTALKVIVFLKKQKLISCDIETSGFNPRKDRIIAVGFTWEKGKSIIFEEEVLQDELVKWNLKGLFESKSIKWLWQNGKFDCKFFQIQFGYDMQIHEDTMLKHYCLDERKGTHDLTRLSIEYLGAEDYEAEFKATLPHKGASYDQAPKEALYKYLSHDTDYPFRLNRIFDKLMEQEGNVRKAYEHLLIPASKMLMEVEIHGILVDLKYIEELEKRYTQELTQMRKDMIDIVKQMGWDSADYVEKTDAKTEPNEFNLNSPKQLAYAIFDLMKLPKYEGKRTTKEDAIKYWLEEVLKKPDDEEKLKEWLDKSPVNKFVHLLAEYRKKSKLYSTYVKGVAEAVEDDGRVHCTFLLHGTETGRLSSRGPNMQNIPRGPEIRNAFIAPPRHVLLQADYSQAELRVLATLSGDDFLRDVYLTGKDLHDEVAREIYGPNFTKEQRVRAKAVNFGIAYGRTEYSLAKEYNMSKAEAKQLINDWFARMPKAKRYIQESRQKPRKGQIPETPFGRRRRFGLITDDNAWAIENEAVNFPIQSTASDLTLRSAIILHEKLKGKAHILNLVHDSILFEVPEDNVKEVAQIVKEVMERVPQEELKTDIPFVVDLEVGQRWGSLKKYE